MSNLFPNLGRGAERLKKSPVDFMTDDGVGPEAVRVSMVSKPDPTGVLEEVDFIPHKRKPPPAPGKGGKKKSKVSKRLTKRKDRRKHSRTHRKKRKGSKTRRKNKVRRKH